MMCCVADESDDDKSLGFGLEVDVGLENSRCRFGFWWYRLEF